MRPGGRRAIRFAALLASIGSSSWAQDAPRAPFATDTARLQPWDRVYQMLVVRDDSAFTIGRRRVTMTRTQYAGEPGWLILETRSGAVAAAESLYVTNTFTPVRWTSKVGAAHLSFQFGRDSVFGGTTGPAGRQNVITAIPRDLIVSTAMIEALLATVTLAPYWQDSVAVLQIDHGTAAVISGELVVIGEEYTAAPAWIVALRAGGKSVVFWVDKQTGALTRLQQTLPLHVGSLLEYRSLASTAVDSTSPQTPP